MPGVRFNPGFTRPRVAPSTNFRAPAPPNPYVPRPAIRGRFGAINLSPTGKPVSPAQGAAAGAAAGSVAGPIGTAIGAAVGVVVGLLSGKPNTAGHIGGWDTQLASAIGALPASAAGIGRQIPFNENSHGLVQMIEALMAVGSYMAWDPSILSNYDVCAHWAMTFGAAVQTLVGSVIANPVGKVVTVNILESPGASHGPINFTYTNPGISVGPDKISATLIMGASGLMYAMIKGLGETAAHASSNANNALAQKVFALMVDNVAAAALPAAAQPTTPVPNVAPAVIAASKTVNAAVAAAPTAAAVATTQAAAAAPAAATPSDDSVLMAQNQAILSALQNLPTGSSQPQAAQPIAVAPAAGLFGLSNQTLLIIGGIAVAAFLFMEKGK